MRQLVFILLFYLSFSAFAEVFPAQHRRLQTLVAKLRNSEIRWDGNFAGLDAQLRGRNARNLIKLREHAVPYLLTEIGNERNSIACHVLLTYLARERFKLSGAEWNELRVELWANGTIKIDADSLKSRVDFWKAYQAKHLIFDVDLGDSPDLRRWRKMKEPLVSPDRG